MPCFRCGQERPKEQGSSCQCPGVIPRSPVQFRSRFPCGWLDVERGLCGFSFPSPSSPVLDLALATKPLSFPPVTPLSYRVGPHTPPFQPEDRYFSGLHIASSPSSTLRKARKCSPSYSARPLNREIQQKQSAPPPTATLVHQFNFDSFHGEHRPLRSLFFFSSHL